MAVLSRRSLSILARPIFTAVHLIVVMAGAAAIVEAGPITFAFDATVSEVRDPTGVAGLLPFEPMLGQSMSGTVTFTPVPFGQSSDDNANLEIVWERETFTAVSQRLHTLNNYAGALDVPVDGLSVACGITEGCATGSSAVVVRELSLILGSFQDVIPTGQLMNSVDSWNEFEDRRIVLGIADSMDRRMRVTASVGPMSAVPEPPNALILFFLVPMITRIYQLRRR